MDDITEFHWLMDMIQNIDVGLIILDREYRVQTWNGFMENHSGISADRAKSKEIFELFPEIDKKWLINKAESVFLLKNQAFTIWEQRPYVFRFKNYRPITGTANFMYQNTTIFPLESAQGEVQYISLLIYDVTDVASNRAALKAANANLKKLSRSDTLTGLYNRGYWEKLLRSEFRRAKRTRHPLSLIMLDIDYFKKINDTYGHQAGDDVIRSTSTIITQCKRETDIAGRYGGEEFCLILIDTTAKNAALFANRLRQTIEKKPVIYMSKKIHYTISLGIAEFNYKFSSHEDWLKASDKALYQSKEGGRNQISIYNHDT